MAEQSGNNNKQFDPMEPWRGLRDIYLDAWAKGTVDMVNTEAYAQATGAMLDSYLTVSTPFREALEKAMLKTLEQLAMPSRADVISIAERMTNIEMRLDDLDAKLDRVLALNTKGQVGVPVATVSSAAKKAPHKTKRPAPSKAKKGSR
jgi:hypothetical protein